MHRNHLPMSQNQPNVKFLDFYSLVKLDYTYDTFITQSSNKQFYCFYLFLLLIFLDKLNCFVKEQFSFSQMLKINCHRSSLLDTGKHFILVQYHFLCFLDGWIPCWYLSLSATLMGGVLVNLLLFFELGKKLGLVFFPGLFVTLLNVMFLDS